MNNKLPFHVSHLTPPAGLLERVLLHIQEKQYRARLWRVRIFAVTAALSLVALIPTSIALWDAIKASQFTTYLSILFSDGGVLALYWKDIVVSLAESLPAITMTATLALIGLLLWSIRSMVRFMNNRYTQAA